MDITTIGEILIDLTQCGIEGVPIFAANPGGAPANLAVAAARLGARTAFIGKVGGDCFGANLIACLKENGVDASGVLVDAACRTTLAVVALDAGGERSFSFYRDPGADTLLRSDELPQALLEATRVLHFGSVSLTAEPARSATLEAVRVAKAHGAWISYDPNYRASLWPDQATAVAQLVQLPDLDSLTVPQLERIVAVANRAASLTASRHGAIPAMPTRAEVFGV